MKTRYFVYLLAVAVLAMSVGLIAAEQKAPTEPIILKGAPMGGVKFQHSSHAAVKCITCHHASKPEKAATSPNQKCTDCHTKVAAAPMKTKLQAAFHDPTAKSGLCITCHTTDAAAKAKKAPTKCVDCHKKTNV
ncbi:MAG: cytochrome c3 family protein [Terriglobales bacterium]